MGSRLRSISARCHLFTGPWSPRLRADDRRSARIGRGDFSWRNSRPRKISDSLAFLIDLLAAVPSVIYGLLGIFVVVPLDAHVIGPFLKSHPRISCRSSKARSTASAFSPPASCCPSWSCHSSSPSRAKCFWPSRGSARSRLGARRHALGSPLGKSCALRAHAEFSARSSWPWPAPWAKPWPSPWSSATTRDQRVALRPGLLDRRGHRQRIHRSHRRSLPESLIELGLVLFLITFILNGLARILIVTTQRRRNVALA